MLESVFIAYRRHKVLLNNASNLLRVLFFIVLVVKCCNSLTVRIDCGNCSFQCECIYRKIVGFESRFNSGAM